MISLHFASLSRFPVQNGKMTKVWPSFSSHQQYVQVRSASSGQSEAHSCKCQRFKVERSLNCTGYTAVLWKQTDRDWFIGREVRGSNQTQKGTLVTWLGGVEDTEITYADQLRIEKLIILWYKVSEIQKILRNRMCAKLHPIYQSLQPGMWTVGNL